MTGPDIILKEMDAIKARQIELDARIKRTKDAKRRDEYMVSWLQLNRQWCALSQCLR